MISHVMPSMRGVALQDIAEPLLHLIFVVASDFVWRIIAEILHRLNLHAINAEGKVHVGALLVTVFVLLFPARSWINGNADILHVGVIANVDATDCRLDIHVLLTAIVFARLVHLYGARRESNTNQDSHQR